MYDIPKGQIVGEAIHVSDPKDLTKVISKDFSGCILIYNNGYGGVERGLLILNGGKIVIADYVHFRFAREIFSDKAMPYIINLFRSDEHSINLIGYTEEELIFVLDLIQKYKLKKPINLTKFIKLLYPEKKSKKGKTEEKKYDIELVRALEQEFIERYKENLGKPELFAEIGDIILQARSREILMKKFENKIDRSEIDRFVLLAKGVPVKQIEDIILFNLSSELVKIDSFDLGEIKCSLSESELNITISGKLYKEKFKPPITSEEIFKEVVEAIIKKLVEQVSKRYDISKVNINIKYDIDIVE